MKKGKNYKFTRFPVEVLKEAHDLYLSKLDNSKKIGEPNCLSLKIDEENWDYDTKDEFFVYYDSAESFKFDHIEQGNRLIIGSSYDHSTDVDVEFSEKKDIDSIFNVFERNLERSKVKISPIKEIKEVKPTSKSKCYYNTKFPIETIKEAYKKFLSGCGVEIGIKIPSTLSITYDDNEKWDLGSLDEFFAEYPKADEYRLDHIIGHNRIWISGNNHKMNAHIESLERDLIQSVYEVFETNLEKGKIAVESPQIEVTESKDPIKIFIGHGRNKQWRDLKDHLHDSHGFEIEAYEIGSRAGFSVKEILESMLNESSFALLVLTGEDLDAEGDVHARENVIHELGLFQGNLGFKRAIVLLEEGTTEFSNICGIQQIRFSKGNIKEVYGDIIATINREFNN